MRINTISQCELLLRPEGLVKAKEKNAKIYVAGHNGLVGSAILCRLQKEGFENIVTREFDELDLTNQAETLAFFEQEKPLPEKEKIAPHRALVCDLKVGYTAYIKQ